MEEQSQPPLSILFPMLFADCHDHDDSHCQESVGRGG